MSIFSFESFLIKKKRQLEYCTGTIKLKAVPLITILASFQPILYYVQLPSDIIILKVYPQFGYLSYLHC